MPELSRFFGIVVRMRFDDHLPPHFHAVHGEHETLIAIDGPAVVDWDTQDAHRAYPSQP